jgi:signal transduction histidine kinase
MRERVALLGGELQIASAPGRGSTVRATIPSGRDAGRGRASAAS